MAQKYLHEAHVGPALQQMRGEGMPQHVRVHAVQPRLERAQQALESVNHAIEASQRIMHNLRPAILEQGLVAALQWMAGQFEKRNGLPCLFRTSHDSMQLPAGVPLVAYRTAQEALTNITRHANAARVLIHLHHRNGTLSLRIVDDGRGIAEESLRNPRSMGILGMRERAARAARAAVPALVVEHHPDLITPDPGQLAALAGIDLPVGPRKRYVYVLDCPAATEALHKAPLTVIPGGVYFRPEGRNFLAGLSPEEHQEPGNLDWDAIVAACRETGVTWYAVEQDDCPGDPFDSLAKSRRFLQKYL